MHHSQFATFSLFWIACEFDFYTCHYTKRISPTQSIHAGFVACIEVTSPFSIIPDNALAIIAKSEIDIADQRIILPFLACLSLSDSIFSFGTTFFLFLHPYWIVIQ